jgi:hypothetical protein
MIAAGILFDALLQGRIAGLIFHRMHGIYFNSKDKMGLSKATSDGTANGKKGRSY